MISFKYNVTFALSLIVALGGLSACSRMYKEGTLTQNRMQVAQEKYVREIPLGGAYQSEINEVSKHYSRHGDDVMVLTIAYNPAMQGQGAMRASQMAADISSQLRSNGITNVKTDVLPIKDLAVMTAMFSYDSYSAKPPKDCDMMSGFEDRDHGDNMDYEMGCTVETVMSRQISRPKDLLGRDFENTHNDARGISNQIDGLHTGERNEPLGGETTQ